MAIKHDAFDITFFGGAGTVTGSLFMLRAGGRRILVDCGLFQGRKSLRGYLVREGFRGPIHATPATADFADILLRDSAHIQEEDAEYANRKGYSSHKPALPPGRPHHRFGHGGRPRTRS